AGHLSQLFKEPQKVQQLALLISFVLEGSIARAGLESSSEKVFAAKQIVQNLLEQEVSK
ncbi:MAG: TetR/AcrR family transcriptional regulator, partial [Acinetobacter sp.]